MNQAWHKNPPGSAELCQSPRTGFTPIRWHSNCFSQSHMPLFRFGTTFLMIFFAVVGVFGREPTRRALVDTAFYQLPFAVEFLMKSPEFQSKMSPDEMDQLRRLYRITAALALAHQFSFTIGPDGFGMPPNDQGLPKLEYSDDPQKFKLNPTEPERSAMTQTALSEPIYINLRYLDSSAQDPSLMDVLQILFHEVGHKLGSEKKQAQIDSVSAKMVQFLKPYYQKLMLSEKLKLEALSLPIDFTRMHFGPTATPLVVIQENGHAEKHKLDLSRISDLFSRFTPEASNMAEVINLRFLNFSGKLGHERDLSYQVNFNLEIKSQPVYNDPRISFQGMTVGFGGSAAMIATPNRHPLTEPSYVNMEAHIRLGRPKPASFTQLIYVETRSSAWDYRDLSLQHRIDKVQTNRNQIQLSISNPTELHQVYLRLRSDQANYQVLGEPLAGEKGGFRFHLPTHLQSASGEIQISEVILNGQYKLPLPEVIRLKTAQNSKPTPLELKGIEYFDGKTWQKYDDSGILQAPEGPLRFRIQVETDSPLSQIRLLWNKGSGLYWGTPDKSIGIFASTEEEIIRDFKLASKTDTSAIYEFSSSEVLKLQLPKTPKPFGAIDSERRFLKEMSLVTSNMKMQQVQFSPYMKLFNAEYIQVKPAKPLIRSCSKILL
jgi:hypothetical protein